MKELDDLINRFQHLELRAGADPVNTAIVILKGPEIAMILNGLAALKATDQVVGGFVEQEGR